MRLLHSQNAITLTTNRVTFACTTCAADTTTAGGRARLRKVGSLRNMTFLLLHMAFWCIFNCYDVAFQSLCELLIKFAARQVSPLLAYAHKHSSLLLPSLKRFFLFATNANILTIIWKFTFVCREHSLLAHTVCAYVCKIH